MPLSRRDFLATAALAAGAPLVRAADDDGPTKGKADSCILLWLGGGACHIDTFDPKRKGDGKKKPGSAYDAIPTAAAGVQICEHLKETARVMDRVAVVRTLHH